MVAFPVPGGASLPPPSLHTRSAPGGGEGPARGQGTALRGRRQPRGCDALDFPWAITTTGHRLRPRFCALHAVRSPRTGPSPPRGARARVWWVPWVVWPGRAGPADPRARGRPAHLLHGVVPLLQLLVAVSGFPQGLQHEPLHHREELRGNKRALSTAGHPRGKRSSKTVPGPVRPGTKAAQEMCFCPRGAFGPSWVSAAAESKVPEVWGRLVNDSWEPLGRESPRSLPTHPFQVPASRSHTVLADLAEATPCPLLEGTPDRPPCRLSSSEHQPRPLEPWQPRGGRGEAISPPPRRRVAQDPSAHSARRPGPAAPAAPGPPAEHLYLRDSALRGSPPTPRPPASPRSPVHTALSPSCFPSPAPATRGSHHRPAVPWHPVPTGKTPQPEEGSCRQETRSRRSGAMGLEEGCAEAVLEGC